MSEPAANISGVVTRVTYSNEESSWSVIQLQATDGKPFTAVGNLFGIQVGERLRLEGRWKKDPRWGQQFHVDSFLALRPETKQGIELYLASGVVKGIGPALARRLVDAFGVDTLDVISEHPRRLDRVEGIGVVRRKRILEAWQEQSEIRNVMIFLQSHGISSHHAAKIFKQYGSRAIAVVRDNPYRLTREIFGIGFASADSIAKRLGVSTDAPQRIEAGALEALFRSGQQGHTFSFRTDLVEESIELLETLPTEVENAIDRLAANRQIAIEQIGQREAIYPMALAIAERGLADHFRARSRRESPGLQLELDLDRDFAWFERRTKLRLSKSQRRAATLALTNRAVVITGGPGTGKTTLTRCIVEIFARQGARIELSAPTGRAAKRLSEATGRGARTIHRLLEFDPRSAQFKRNSDHRLDADLLVVDEVSMIDVALAYHLTKALPEGSSVVFIGDVDQLPSVGPGRVLGDLIDSGVLAVARLTEVFRQAEASQIVVNAHRINLGQMPSSPPTTSSDFFFIERTDPESIIATLQELVLHRIPRSFSFDVAREVQILTPMRRGRLGAENLNRKLQEWLNPTGTTLDRRGRLLRRGDRVMQIRNNYELEVFNGDIGRIQQIDSEQEVVSVAVENRLVAYEAAHLDELALSYACSIHKSQGSEFPCVIVLIHHQHYLLLQRNLLYTAITRGRKLVVVLGSRRAVSTAVGNIDTRRRNTLLVDRLQGELG